MESSQVDLLGLRETAQPFATRRRTIVAVAGLLAMFVAVSVWQSPGSFTKSNVELFTELDLVVGATNENGCAALPFVHLGNIVSSNLGKKGPDKDAEEGIIYNASLHNSGVNISDFQIHLHSETEFNGTHYDNEYVPEWTKGDFINGKHGMFASVNIRQGTSVKLQLHAHDLGTHQDSVIPVGYITFFDLDAGKQGNHSVEYVKVVDTNGMHYFLTNETQINATQDGNVVTFRATKEGTGDDNPTDPTSLTIEQKNKAVTIKMEQFTSFDFEIGASPGFTGRVFEFVLRPSLLCAKTKLENGTEVDAKGSGAPIEIEETPKSSAHKQLPELLLSLGLLWVFGQ